MKNVSVIIANWNGKEHLVGCLHSLSLQTYKEFEIIVVDNGSSDDSVEFIEKNYPEVAVIKLKENTGFAFANNVGIKKVLENKGIEFVITLNNDTTPESDYIEEMVACARRHPEAGSIQPKVINYFDQKIIDSTGILIYKDMSAINRGQKEFDAGQYEEEEEIFGASASASLYARNALESAQLFPGEFFDNMHFAYYEDVDLAWRLRLFGFSSFYAPMAKVLHVHSATGKNFSPFKAFHIHRNQYYNMIKNLPFLPMIRAFLFMPVRYGLLISSVLIKKGPSSELSQNKEKKGIIGIVLKSWIDVLKNISELLKKRRIVQKNKKVGNREIKKWFSLYRADIKKIIYG